MFWQTAHARTIDLPQASDMAPTIDIIHDFIFWSSVFLLALVTIALFWLVTSYHKGKTGRKTEQVPGSHLLETIWTVLPAIFFMGCAIWGWIAYKDIRKNDLKNPVEVNVVGRQWLWEFEYPNGRKTLNKLYLPKGQQIRLIITASDVLHSFFVPNFRLKQDAVPGLYTFLNFTITEGGNHPIYCTEFCGTSHSDMLGEVIVMEPDDYKRWVATGKVPGGMAGSESSGGVIETAKADDAPAKAAGGDDGASLVDQGKKVFQAKGCFACHSTDGVKKVGPSIKGIFGQERELADGTKATADENYLRRSLMDPQKEVVKGYPPSMPTFRGLISEEEVRALIAYIKSLK